MNLSHKHIILTGSASGIGRSLLRLLARYPLEIVCADIQQEALNRVVAEMGETTARVHTFAGDLSNQTQIDALFTYAQDTMGSVDIFIANAGYAYYESLETADWQRIDAIYRLNVISPIYSAAKMRELHPQGNYTVVLLASAMAYMAVPGYSVYASTKAAIDRFAEGHRYELPATARLMIVYPVATKTHFFAGAGNDVPVLPPTQTPQQVAQVILYGLEHDRAKVFPHAAFRWMRFSAITLQLMRLITGALGGRQFRQWRARQAKSV